MPFGDCRTYGCRRPAGPSGFCQVCDPGDLADFNGIRDDLDYSSRHYNQNAIMTRAKNVHEAGYRDSALAQAGGIEMFTRLLQAAGVAINGMAFMNMRAEEISGMAAWAQAKLSGQEVPFPSAMGGHQLPADHDPGEDPGIPYSDDMVRSTEILWIRRPDYNEARNIRESTDPDVRWLRSLGFRAEEADNDIVCTIHRDKLVVETERLADLVDGTNRAGTVSANYLPRTETAHVIWKGRDKGARPGQFRLQLGPGRQKKKE